MDMFENCKFLDEKLNDVDCSVERDTRNYVGEMRCVFLCFALNDQGCGFSRCGEW